MGDLDALFCGIDDFCKGFYPLWEKSLLEEQVKKRRSTPCLSASEIITIMVLFHQSNYRTFKHFYVHKLQAHQLKDFPLMPSYSWFVRLMKSVLIPLTAYLSSLKGVVSGIAYVDSTSIKVCHNKRINNHKVFSGYAKRGKSTMGWFFGFKLHLITNEKGELLSFKLTPGNRDDRKVLDSLTKGVWGKLFGDKGYIGEKWVNLLKNKGVQLITNVRKNMKPKAMKLIDKVLLRKRFIIETINDQLKNISQIEHSRHRSLENFMVNMASGLIAYCLQPKKPSICGVKNYPLLTNDMLVLKRN